jgi:hypothetical protein
MKKMKNNKFSTNVEFNCCVETLDLHFIKDN